MFLDSLLQILTASFVFASVVPNAYGKICTSTSSQTISFCSSDQYCCGYDNDSCCETYTTYTSTNYAPMFVAFAGFVFLFICCPIACYRCCCRRTTSQGFVYSQNPATTVSVTLPPQQNQTNMPYPNTMPPYPNTTPYPAPYPATMPYPQTNPYYGKQQPPPYSTVQEQNQQASAPAASAPPY